MQSYAWACQKVENSKPSADLPWERPELALPEPQDDFSALQLERGGPKGVGTGAGAVQMLPMPGQRYVGSQEQQSPSFSAFRPALLP